MSQVMLLPLVLSVFHRQHCFRMPGCSTHAMQGWQALAATAALWLVAPSLLISAAPVSPLLLELISLKPSVTSSREALRLHPNLRLHQTVKLHLMHLLPLAVRLDQTLLLPPMLLLHQMPIRDPMQHLALDPMPVLHPVLVLHLTLWMHQA